MMSQDIVPLRTLLRAFPGIPVKEAKELIASGDVLTYPVGTILCHEDVYESTFYIILDGKVRVTKLIDQDQVRTLSILEANDFFGEMALIQEAPRAATVTTLTPTTVLEIYKDAFNEQMRQSASLARAMVQEVVRRLRENDQMAIEDLRIKAGELAAAYQELAEQDYARRQFLSTIAHELRTPLTAAAGYLQMIQMGLVSGQSLDSEIHQAALRSASRNLDQIIALVNDILFVQEMDLILMRSDQVDLSAVLTSIVEGAQRRAEESRVVIHLEIASGLPQITGDSRSLRRAFQAILDNAIKFSPDGGDVEIRAETHGNWIKITIRDHGVGIPKEILPRVFDRFFHLDQVGGHMFRGLGLGLSIARQVIEQHQGSIQVESEPGKGTLVTVTLGQSE
jgi:signal transduction histidine kinase